MKLQGSAILAASREKVWELLTDPVQLAKCLPGCERLEPIGEDQFRAAVKFGIAAITGKYAGKVALTERRPPSRLRIHMEGKGAPGFMKGEGTIELVERRGETELKYSGEAHVGGLIASVGQRMIEAAAKRIVQQFFDSANKLLKNPPEED